MNEASKTPCHIISFARDGTARCLWAETVPLLELGRLEIQRASTIEFSPTTQEWEVRLASSPGVIAFSNSSRETCLNWERNTLNALL
jgi:hypothetical protein